MLGLDMFFFHTLTAAAGGMGWRGWPFSGWGYEGGFLVAGARVLFVALLLGGIAVLLRLLFGPGGPLREKGWEAMQEAEARRKAEAEAAQGREQGRPGEREPEK